MKNVVWHAVAPRPKAPEFRKWYLVRVGFGETSSPRLRIALYRGSDEWWCPTDPFKGHQLTEVEAFAEIPKELFP